ncbi:MAG: hypothetical protein DRJ13_05260, partial [Bacteroidetes bacterium]
MKKIITDDNALDQYQDILGEEAKEFLLDIINTFLNDAPKQIAVLDDSLATQDSPSFQRAAHTLKSNLKIVGAIETAEACNILEDKGAAGDLNQVEDLLNGIKQDM